ncbi:MAG: polysaccharide biosynthesis tyrosine autokinase [Rhodocyclaceae bacterium]|nr:polysaccharide biosynthesis tyrosine autokinase [Rhodocyclaceae bacterium]
MQNSGNSEPEAPFAAESPKQGTSLIERRESTALAAPMQWRSAFDEEDDDTINLREYWAIIVKRKWTVITFFTIVVMSVITATFLMTPIYRSSLTLQIDRQEAKVVEFQTVTPTEMPSDAREFYQTQYELLQSRALAQRVIDQLNLGAHPLFAPRQNESIRAIVRDWFGVNDKSVASRDAVDIERNRVVKQYLDQLKIDPVRNSRLVKIHFESPDAALAARIVNAISDSFISLNLERRMDASSYAATFLEERLQQIKLKLEQSEKALVEFAREEQIVRSGNQDSIDTQVMQEFTTALARAQQERIRAEAMFKQIQSGKVDGLPIVLENKVIQEFKQLKAKLEAEYQENLRTFKPAYPKMQELKGKIDEIQARIVEELNSIRSGIRATYESARAQEGLLQAKMDESKQNVLSVQDRSIQYNILKREVDTNRQLYDGLLQRYKEVGVAGGVGINNVSVVDRAEVPVHPHKPNKTLNVLIAAVVGLFGGIGLAFLFEHLDDTVKGGEDLERLMGLPVLGVVPLVRSEGGGRVPELVSEQLKDVRSAFSEAYRSLRTALQFSTAQGMPRVLMVTSASMGEGKSTTAMALSVNLALAGAKVLLIDADLRKASLHRKLGLDNSCGLTNHLAGDAEPVDITQPTQYERMFVITSGPLPPNPAELLGGHKMRALLDLARSRFDCIVVDGPPVLGLADAPLLGTMTDAVVVVVESAATRKDFLSGALKRLRGTRTHVIGSVLTKVDARGGSYGYYHNYYYQYGGSQARQHS